MSNIIKNYLKETRFVVSKKTSSIYSEEESVICDILESAWYILMKFKDKYDSEGDKPIVASFSLLTKSINSILASYELCMEGYIIESGVLLRHIIEAICVSYDIYINEDRFKDFLYNKEKFKSTKSIKPTKNLIPEIGNIYGILTEFNTHISTLNCFPNFAKVKGDKIEFFIGGGIPTNEEESEEMKGEIYKIFSVAIRILQLVEYIFKDYVSEFKMWKNINNRLVICPCDKYIDWFKRLINWYDGFRNKLLEN